MFEILEGSNTNIRLVAYLDEIMKTMIDSLVDKQDMNSLTPVTYYDVTADVEKSCTGNNDIDIRNEMKIKTRGRRTPTYSFLKLECYLPQAF